MSLWSGSGSGPDSESMVSNKDRDVVVGAVVETMAGQAPNVACRLESIAGMEVVGGDGKSRLAIVWRLAFIEGLEREMEYLVKMDDDILAVAPLFAGPDDHAGVTQARSSAMKQLIDDQKVLPSQR